MAPSCNWEFWIDVGGTFTDCLARGPDGPIQTHKVLSSGTYKGKVESGSDRNRIETLDRREDPPGFFEGYGLSLLAPAGTRDPGSSKPLDSDVPITAFDPSSGRIVLGRPLHVDPTESMTYEISSGEEAPVVGIRWLMGKRLGEEIGPVTVRLGTTRGTNALLERQGAPTAFVTTRGFGDVLRIAYQNRPKLFDLYIRKPTDLYHSVVELDERLDAQGNVLRPLDRNEVRDRLGELVDQGITSLAVCLLNSYRSGVHEEIVAQIASELGFEQVSVSSRLAPMQRIVSRGDTTIVDAYVSPIIREYIAGIRIKLPQAVLKLMTSAGGLVDAERFVGKDSILSGPAGGVVGVAHVSRQAGFEKAIGFDMGGTSTDVSRFDGRFERRYSMELNDPESDTGVRIVAPMLAIETVAAGGGSICDFDGQKPIVGPRSAGSDPGPACYGKGGPLCVTDVNLFLGKILPDRFAFPLDPHAARHRLTELCERIERETGNHYSLEQLAVGFTRIANANMAATIKKVSIAKGYDVREYVLVSFGGAGAQHACAIAAELGIEKILQHPHAGVLSAFGIGMADIEKFAERHIGKILGPEAIEKLEPIFSGMETELHQQVLAEGVPDHRILPPTRLLDLRYRGQESTITVQRPEEGDYAHQFEILHRQLFGFAFPDRPIEIHVARLEMTGHSKKPEPKPRPVTFRRPEPDRWSEVFLSDRWQPAAVFEPKNLQLGDVIDGPAIVTESTSTIVIEPGWRAELFECGMRIAECGMKENSNTSQVHNKNSATRIPHSAIEPDSITLELFNNQFVSIAEQMGETLRKTSLSTNVKERLDFSCALFSASGDLVVNAPHIPVHLGAMGETVRKLIEDVPEMHLGDVFVTNDPYRGGSHLPDVTVITPVFDDSDKKILFFTGSRAHHAEIGGIVPGSMPPYSKSLAEEGVLIRAFRLVKNEKSSEQRLRGLLAGGRYPTRSLEENIADINAQVAANRMGVLLIEELVQCYGLATVRSYMGHIQKAAENKMRRALLKISEGEHHFSDRLDNGAVIAVRISVQHNGQGGEAVVDFTGTDPVLPDNLNANPAIVRSAVLYCFRCLIDEDIPLNDGVLAPISIHVPEGCLLNPPASPDPSQCPAVGGGNVETSQRVVDVLFGALSIVAASQGTMNNLLFGQPGIGDRPGFGYYETICGGAGAGPGFSGASAVHTHMTNTRITDPEVLEARYPVRLRQFAIRRGSGGNGKHPGGDGVIREIEFLEDVDLSLVTNRRTTTPYGQAGGSPGKSGLNLLYELGSSKPENLGSFAQRTLCANSILRIETPGGGGWGSV